MANNLQKMINLCNTWIAVDQRQSQQLINPLTDPDDDEEEIFYHLNHLFVHQEERDEDSEMQDQRAMNHASGIAGQRFEAMQAVMCNTVDRLIQSLDEPVSVPTSSSAHVHTTRPEVYSPAARVAEAESTPAVSSPIVDSGEGEESARTPARRLLSNAEPMAAATSGGSKLVSQEEERPETEEFMDDQAEEVRDEVRRGVRVLVVPEVHIPLRIQSTIQTDDLMLKSYAASVTTGMKERAKNELMQKENFMRSGWPILMPGHEERMKQMIFFKDPELNSLLVQCLTRPDVLSSLSRTVRICARIFWTSKEFLIDHVTRNIFFNRALSRGTKLLTNLVHFYDLFVHIFDYHDATEFNGSLVHKHVYTHLSNFQMQLRISQAGGRAAVTPGIGVAHFLAQWRNSDPASAAAADHEDPHHLVKSGKIVRRGKKVSIRRRRRRTSTSSNASRTSSSQGSGKEQQRERVMPDRRVKNEAHERLSKLLAQVEDHSEEDDDLIRVRKKASVPNQQPITSMQSSSVTGFSQQEAHNVGIRLRKLTSQPYISSPDPRREPESWLTQQVEERICKIHLFTSNSHEQDQLLRKLILRDDSIADLRNLVKNVAVVMIGRNDIPPDHEDDENHDDRMSEDDSGGGAGSGTGAGGDRRFLVKYSSGFKSTVLLLMQIFGHDWKGPSDVEKFKQTNVYEHLINFIHDNDFWLD